MNTPAALRGLTRGNRRRLVLVAVPVLLLLVLLAAVLRGGQATSEMSDAGGGSAADSELRAVPGGRQGVTAGDGSDSGSAGGDTSATSPESGDKSQSSSPQAAPMNRQVISTGQVTLHAENLARARSEVLRMTTAWGGTVADEQTESDQRGRVVASTITLRVPSPRFAAAMIALGDLGKVEQTSRSSEDVTTQVIDTDARIRAAERSIRQIERLLGRAQALSDIIAIESDLARRQADLDSLKQQRAYLEDQTSLSTINVYLSRPVTEPREKEEAEGFLAGLTSGWNALQGATVVVLTILGALLPFAVVVLVLGVPLWLLGRRYRRTTPAPAAPVEA